MKPPEKNNKFNQTKKGGMISLKGTISLLEVFYHFSASKIRLDKKGGL
jgi:hypothetical protein